MGKYLLKNKKNQNQFILIPFNVIENIIEQCNDSKSQL